MGVPLFPVFWGVDQRMLTGAWSPFLPSLQSAGPQRLRPSGRRILNTFARRIRDRFQRYGASRCCSCLDTTPSNQRISRLRCWLLMKPALSRPAKCVVLVRLSAFREMQKPATSLVVLRRPSLLYTPSRPNEQTNIRNAFGVCLLRNSGPTNAPTIKASTWRQCSRSSIVTGAA